jgi:uncharacterized protein (DUF2336 family)
MMVAATLIPELEEAIRRGSPERQAALVHSIAALFVDGASRFNDDHIQVFDDVLGRLLTTIDAPARSDLAHRLAWIGNAPAGVIRTLAQDPDIAVAACVLQRSRRLADSDLVAIANTGSQAHLLALAGRAVLGEPVTDALLARGDAEVARHLAGNGDARFSERGFAALIGATERDGVLAETIALRPDFPPRLFGDLLAVADDATRQRILASATPETQPEIRSALGAATPDAAAPPPMRDYTAACRSVAALQDQGQLTERQVFEFARNAQFDETVAALALSCAVPIEVVDRLMNGGRPDPVLILCKAAGWSWPTAKAIIAAQPSRQVPDGPDQTFASFERLSAESAQRVMRFWKAR